jgi:CheY-like chemotaxis protein
VKKIGTRSAERRSTLTSLRPSMRREVLLYVEDDDDNWRVAQLRLSEGYELVRARNSAEACQSLEYRGMELSAILMDIELRGSDLDGVQLTQLVRGKTPRDKLPGYARRVSALNTPIIFVTAHGAKYGDAQLILAGGDKVISKPIDFGALNLALTQLHLSRMGIKRKP